MRTVHLQIGIACGKLDAIPLGLFYCADFGCGFLFVFGARLLTWDVAWHPMAGVDVVVVVEPLGMVYETRAEVFPVFLVLISPTCFSYADESRQGEIFEIFARTDVFGPECALHTFDERELLVGICALYGDVIVATLCAVVAVACC